MRRLVDVMVGWGPARFRGRAIYVTYTCIETFTSNEDPTRSDHGSWLAGRQPVFEGRALLVTLIRPLVQNMAGKGGKK